MRGEVTEGVSEGECGATGLRGVQKLLAPRDASGRTAAIPADFKDCLELVGLP